jgi:hypothetical protein
MAALRSGPCPTGDDPFDIGGVSACDQPAQQGRPQVDFAVSSNGHGHLPGMWFGLLATDDVCEQMPPGSVSVRRPSRWRPLEVPPIMGDLSWRSSGRGRAAILINEIGVAGEPDRLLLAARH